MLIEVRILRGPSRSWQAKLCRSLADAGHGVRVAQTGAAEAEPVSLALLMQMEALLYRSARVSQPGQAGALFETQQFHAEGAAELVIDLTGAAAPGALAPIWQGQTHFAGAIAALLGGRSPELAVARCGAAGEPFGIMAAGIAALEEPHVFTASLGRVCGRMGDLMFQAVRGVVTGARPAAVPPAKAASPAQLSPLRFGLEQAASRITQRLNGLLSEGPKWRVAWRQGPGSTLEKGEWGAAPFQVLPDDGKRYFADPFVLQHEGVTHVLCEEFPYATGRGLISAFTLSASGGASAPRPVMEAPSHLSYPMIFAHGGAIYMIPETGARRTLELWRAENFPDGWVCEAVLLEGIEASDATLIEHGGRFWILATIRENSESTWDALGVFYSENLRGPWRPHCANPVQIDAGAARPAGHMQIIGGRLWRPAQDCRSGYGAGLSLCRIDRLDPEGFKQSVVSLLAAPRLASPGLKAKGVHTLNFAEGVEVIDIFAG